jgi:AcrR family transcriptional regulator
MARSSDAETQAPSLDTKSRPSRQRGIDTFEVILTTAGELLAEVGFERLTTNLVCERAGLTPPALYRYFPNKYALLKELAHRLMDAQDQVVLAWLENGGTHFTSLEESVAKNRDLQKQVNAVTRAFPGGDWILRALRALPVLQEVRTTSRDTIALTLFDILRAANPETERGPPAHGHAADDPDDVRRHRNGPGRARPGRGPDQRRDLLDGQPVLPAPDETEARVLDAKRLIRVRAAARQTADRARARRTSPSPTTSDAASGPALLPSSWAAPSCMAARRVGSMRISSRVWNGRANSHRKPNAATQATNRPRPGALHSTARMTALTAADPDQHAGRRDAIAHQGRGRSAQHLQTQRQGDRQARLTRRQAGLGGQRLQIDPQRHDEGQVEEHRQQAGQRPRPQLGVPALGLGQRREAVGARPGPRRRSAARSPPGNQGAVDAPAAHDQRRQGSPPAPAGRRSAP